MKSQTPQVVPAIDAVLDLASVCAIVLTRGLDLVHLDSKSNYYLARLVSCNYRLLPYAIEFWIEHCSQYTTSVGSPDLNGPIQGHLARLYEKHKTCLDTLGQTTVQARIQDENQASQLDERLKLFSHIAVHELIVDVSSLKWQASQLDGDSSSGKFRSY